MKKYISDKKYVQWGLTALAVIAISIVCNHLLSKWSYAMGAIRVVTKAMRPIFLGIVFAYVLNPLLNIIEKKCIGRLYAKIFKSNEKLRFKMMRGTSILLAFAIALAIVAGLIMLILPELYSNIQGIVSNFDKYVDNTMDFVTNLTKDYPDVAVAVKDYLGDLSGDLIKWLQETLLPNVNVLITNISMGIYGTFKVALDVVLGMIVAVYLLAAKEKYAAGAKKYLYAFLKNDHARDMIRLVKYTDNHFGGFLVGKIVDSMIIGALSFVVFSIFNLPYTILVSVIVGVTNVIPFFGPFLGAIPCGLLILLVNPVKALIFAILILAIQQLDGNVIGPKILGDKTGLDSFAVVFAILIFGGVFGVVGMIVGVPVFATIFGIVTDVCNKRLEKKNLPIKLSEYNGELGPEISEEDKTE